MRLRTSIAAIAVLAVVPTIGLAERVEIPPTQDTYISYVDSTLSFAAVDTLPVHTTIGGVVQALMQFDLSSIPASAEINLAYLYVYDANGPTNDSPVYETTSGWIDNLVNWTNRPSYDATELGVLDGHASAGWRYVELTDLVRQWHDGTKSNHGVTIGGGLMVAGTVPRKFHSVENWLNPPHLVVIYDSDSVQLDADKDTWVSFSDQSTNNGTSATLQVQKYGRWSYLQFDPASLPAGATIEFARLRVYEYAGNDFFNKFVVGAHLVNSPWDELTLTWLTRPSHFPSPPYVKGPVGQSGETGWIDIDVTSYVDTWYDTPASNDGVLVKYPHDTGISASGPIGSFRSREYADSTFRPVVEVFYTTPPTNDFGPGVPLIGAAHSEAVWGDWDNDGDLDLVYCGNTDSGYATLTYENLGGVMTPVANTIQGVVQDLGNQTLALGDYDNDGDLDLAVTGWTGTDEYTGIYENDGAGNFTEDTSQSLAQLRYSSLAWGDWDNDGDLDLYLQGHDGGGWVSILYENDPSATPTLQDSGVPLTQLYEGSAAWVDWDNDGDLDLSVTGFDLSTRQTILYENTGSALTAISHGLPDIIYGDLQWGDYDNDGDMDLALLGEDFSTNTYGQVYENDADTLTLAWTADTSFRLGTCAWGDYDNDGKLDIAFCGYRNDGTFATHIYHNDGVAGFSRHAAPLVQDVYYGSVTWADYDDDGDLDLFVTGRDLSANKYAVLYPNQQGTVNTPPTAPNSFTTIRRDPLVPLADRKLYIQWAGGSDAETPNTGLYYCVRVGTSPGGDDILSGTYDSPLMGNVGQADHLEITIPPVDQPYYWQVKTIDSGLMASDWSVRQCSWAPDSVWSGTEKPVDDAFTCSGLPGTCFGATADSINLFVGDYSGGTTSRAYLKFYLGGAFPDTFGVNLDTVRVESAWLFAYCASVNPVGLKVGAYGVNSDTWDERTICWFNAPTSFYPYAFDVDVARAGQWSMWDVTNGVKGTVDWNLTIALRAVKPPEGTPGINAEYRSKEWNIHSQRPYLVIIYSTSVGVDGTPEYRTLVLGQNYPNPFNPRTRVTYTIPDDAGDALASLKIYDVAGRLVRTLVEAPHWAGVYEVDWDGTNDHGARVASGVYFYQLRCDGTAQTKKMLLLK